MSHPHSCLSQELSYKLVQRRVTRYLCLVFADVFLTVRFDVQSVLIFEFCMVYAPCGCLIRRAYFSPICEFWRPLADIKPIFPAFPVKLRASSSHFRNLRPRFSPDEVFLSMWNPAAGFRVCSSYFSRRGTRTPRTSLR